MCYDITALYTTTVTRHVGVAVILHATTLWCSASDSALAISDYASPSL